MPGFVGRDVPLKAAKIGMTKFEQSQFRISGSLFWEILGELRVVEKVAPNLFQPFSAFFFPSFLDRTL